MTLGKKLLISAIFVCLCVVGRSQVETPDTSGIEIPVPEAEAVESEIPDTTNTSVDTSETEETSEEANNETATSTESAKPASSVDLANATDTVIISFVKETAELKADSLLFNIVNIDNRTSESITGILNISVPEAWSYSGANLVQITIPAGEQKIFPFYVGISRNAIGGENYVINASFQTTKAFFSYSSYVRIPRESKWYFETINRLKYLNEYEDGGDFKVRFKNFGNTQEIIRVDFKTGELLKFKNYDTKTPTEYFIIPPNTDTTYAFNVYKDKELPKFKKKYYENNWYANMIRMTASSNQDTLYESVRFRQLKSIYEGKLNIRELPLTIDVRALNLVSQTEPRFSLNASGKLLFKKDRDLTYGALVPNLSLSGNLDQAYRFSRIRAYYQDHINRYGVEVGDILNNSNYGLFGFGVRGHYQITDEHYVEAMAVRNRFTPVQGIGALYRTSALPLSNLIVWGGGSYSQQTDRNDNGIQAFIGGQYRFLNNHSVSAEFHYALNQINSLPQTTTANDIGYNFSYNYRDNKLDISANSRMVLRALNNTKSLSHRLYSTYEINRKSVVGINFTGNGNRQSTYADLIGLDFNFFDNYYGQLFYRRIMSPSWVISAGPEVFYNVRNNFFFGDDSPRFRVINRGILANSTYKITDKQTISSYMGYGFSSASTEESFLDFENDNLASVTYRTGINYQNRIWNVNFSYQYGAFGFSNLFILPGDTLPSASASQNFQFRTGLRKKFNEDRMRISGFLNYMIFSPSNRQNISTYARLDYFVNPLLRLYISANSFLNTREDEQIGSVTNRNINISAGVRKSFDIKQPRLKYYDLKVVIFKDVDGDQVKGEKEPVLRDILMDIERKKVEGVENARFPFQTLIASVDGEMNLYRVPEGFYTLNFNPLKNTGDLYNVNGDVQEIAVTQNTTIYIPYAEAYKLKGRLVLVRDDLSADKGTFNLAGIRVMATSKEGGEFFTLTDVNGEYSLDVPAAGNYVVKPNNIFGDQFYPDKEQYTVHFNGFKSFVLDFHFYEKKREINVGDGELLYDFRSFNSLESAEDNVTIEDINAALDELAAENADSNILDSNILDIPSPENRGDETIEEPKPEYKIFSLDKVINRDYEANEQALPEDVDPELIKFKVQVGFYENELPEEEIQRLLTFESVERVKSVDGFTRYTIGLYNEYMGAGKLKNKIKDEFPGAFVIAEYDGLTIRATKAIELINEK